MSVRLVTVFVRIRGRRLVMVKVTVDAVVTTELSSVDVDTIDVVTDV